MTYIWICAVILCFLAYMHFETTLLKKSSITFSKSSKGLKIVHLSDIHINKLYISADKIVKSIAEIKPDIILLSGDYIEKEKNIPEFIKFLCPIAASYPVYLTLGNHDHKALKYNIEKISSFINLIYKTGAAVLLNESIRIEKNNTHYNIIGIDDLKHGNPDINRAFKDIVPSIDSDCINIVFSHNPDIVLSLPPEKVDYLFCGHFHGGQIWMPFHLEFKLMRKENLSKMGYYRGLHKIRGINIYINRGLGNVVFPFRLLSRPEIAGIQMP